MLLILPGPVLAWGLGCLHSRCLRKLSSNPFTAAPGPYWASCAVPTSGALGSQLRGPRPRAGSLAWRAGGLHACLRPPRLPAAAGLLSTLAYCLLGVGGSVIGAEWS